MAKRLLIVAHAPSENTLSLRAAVERGARSETGIEVRVVAPLQAGPDDVLAAQAVILGTTENLGYMSGALKDFFDRSYNPCLEKTQGLPYALYIRAGSDGTGTRRGVETITTGLRWRAVQEPLICKGAWQPAFVEQCEELGAAMAAGLGRRRDLLIRHAAERAGLSRSARLVLLLRRVVHHHGDVGGDMVRRTFGGLVLLHDGAAIGRDRRHRAEARPAPSASCA